MEKPPIVAEVLRKSLRDVFFMGWNIGLSKARVAIQQDS